MNESQGGRGSSPTETEPCQVQQLCQGFKSCHHHFHHNKTRSPSKYFTKHIFKNFLLQRRNKERWRKEGLAPRGFCGFPSSSNVFLSNLITDDKGST